MNIKIKGTYVPDFEGYVYFGDVSHAELGQQTQYSSRYFNGLFPEEYPDLSEGLRFRDRHSGDYHSIMIHQDDIPELVRRYHEHRREELGMSEEQYLAAYSI